MQLDLETVQANLFLASDEEKEVEENYKKSFVYLHSILHCHIYVTPILATDMEVFI